MLDLLSSNSVVQLPGSAVAHPRFGPVIIVGG